MSHTQASYFLNASHDEEAAALEQLHEKGVRLEAKLQPADDAIADFYQVMKDKRKS